MDDEPVRDTDRARGDGRDKRRLAEIFGDVLPETTADERERSADEQRESDLDSWYLRNRPPHHG
ncbi:MAG: hypothetical protein ACRDQ5_09735 [Sciscionella sp.]